MIRPHAGRFKTIRSGGILERVELALHPLAELPISAASGVVSAQGRLWIAADDETALTSCALDGSDARSHPLPLASLPAAHAARKAQKPDFEALFATADGVVYALGSGSTAARMRGACLAPGDAPRLLDLRPLYEALLRELPELNLEAAALTTRALVLLSRGNGARRENALVRLDAARALAQLRDEGRWTSDLLLDITRVPLGELLSAPLGFTDATPHPDGGLLFSAAAEASADTYQDGLCTGSIVGCLSEDGALGTTAVATPCHKLEGLCVVAADAERLELRLVADPDDRSLRAALFRASWPRAVDLARA